MEQKMSSIFTLSDSFVRHKGSGAHIIAGILILIVGLVIGQSLENEAIIYVSAAKSAKPEKGNG
jgi:hypothetical protein